MNEEALRIKKLEYYRRNKEKINKKRREEYKRGHSYYHRNKELCNKKLRKKYYKEKSIKEFFEEIKKPIKMRKKSIRKRSKNYLDNITLTKEIIISKAKGRTSQSLKKHFYLICRNLNRKFIYTDENLRGDIIHDSFLFVCENYHNFNEKKYKNSFSYISEIIKRSQAKSYRKMINKNISIDELMNKK